MSGEFPLHQPDSLSEAEQGFMALLVVCEPYLTEDELALMTELGNPDEALDYAVSKIRAAGQDPDEVLSRIAA